MDLKTAEDRRLIATDILLGSWPRDNALEGAVSQ
jgi:hypothetical protein